jgi:hypothetical protein
MIWFSFVSLAPLPAAVSLADVSFSSSFVKDCCASRRSFITFLYTPAAFSRRNSKPKLNLKLTKCTILANTEDCAE